MNASRRVPLLNSVVIVGALGYFVDIYDLVLFSIVRIPSLRALAVPEEKILEVGVYLLNMQMTGMLLGGLIWGILGDKKGRLSVLFGSIVLYSIANLANAYVSSVEVYGILRLLAGIGLAGELGAAVTLVSETMSKETRGYGTMIVASVGLLGAVVAGLVGDYFPWRTAYLVGGGLGLLLLVMRVGLLESGMYQSIQNQKVRKGDLLLLFSSWERFSKYVCCILMGLPTWFIIGILITFSPEICKALGVKGTVSAGNGILFSYLGISLGDLSSGYLSQYFKSRKKIVFVFLWLVVLFSTVYLFSHDRSPAYYYFVSFLLGFAGGYWAVFVTVAAEQFGTNLRATVAISVPNFVRGSVVPLTLAFKGLKDSMGLVNSALIVGAVAIGLAFLSLYGIDETYATDLDFIEAN